MVINTARKKTLKKATLLAIIKITIVEINQIHEIDYIVDDEQKD